MSSSAGWAADDNEMENYRKARAQAIQDDEIRAVMRLIERELRRALTKHKTPMRSTHEGWVIIWEELDEMWNEVRANNTTRSRVEAVQVGAMAARYLLEVK